MAATVVDLYNRALSIVGTRSSVTATNDGRVETRELNKVYAATRDGLLTMHDWPFARFTDLLVTQSLLVAPANWAYAYARPAYMLKTLYLLVPGAPPDRYDGMPVVPYETAAAANGAGVDVDVIFTDQSPAYMRFTKQVTDVTRYPADFETALCTALASNVAVPLGRGAAVAQALGKSFFSLFNVAAAKAANEGTSRQNDQLAPWQQARG